METKFISIVLIFILGFSIVPLKENSKKECCHKNVFKDDVLIKKKKKYLKDLKEKNKTDFINSEKQVDSLGSVIIFKNNKINKLSKQPKEIIVIKTDTVFIKEKKNFWGKITTDTL